MKLHPDIYLTVLLLTVCISTLRVGAGENQPTNNPTGTWKVTQIPKSTYSPTLKLKFEGDKLTGTLTRNTGTKIEELAIQDGKLKGSEITFTVHFFAQVLSKNGVPQPPDTNYISHWKFQGTISGDIIKGKVEKESSIAGIRTQEWEARRVQE
jgi:hypothetical protein